MLDLCIEEPLNAFLSDEVNLPRLIALLKEVEKAVESGEVELSPRERRKRLGQIKTMLDGGLLELRRKYEKMLMEKAAKEEAYASSPILKKKAELEKSLEAHRSELKKIQSEFKEISKDIEKIEEEIKRNKSELEDEASTLLGVKLKII
jgi:chromosome segregation ATPase